MKTPPDSVSRVKPFGMGRERGQGCIKLAFFVASGVSRIIILPRAGEKLQKIREFEPTHFGCYVMIDELDAALERGRASEGGVIQPSRGQL